MNDANVTTKKKIAYDNIRSSIVKGEITPKDPISVQFLSKKLNMSVAPIRDALHQLAAEGFITIVPGKGVYVNEISFSEAQELYEFMVYIEQIIFKNIINILTEEDFQTLEKILKKQNKAVTSLDYYLFMDLNNEFHFYFHDKYYNKTICNYDKRLRDRFFQISLASMKRPGRMMQSFQQHNELLEALKERNPIRVNEVIESHIYDAQKCAIL